MISVIITTKNESRHLPELLDSLKKQSYKNFEVIVVDNGSTDDTKEIARKAGARIFDKGPERSAQRNFGVQKARGRYVLILDADMRLAKDVLSDGLREFERNKCGALVIPEKSIGVGFWAKVKAYERSFYVGEDSIEAARFFRKDVFQKFGGYDTSMTGPEDYDLPYRMRQGGIGIGRIKSFILNNEGQFSPVRSAKKKFYYAYVSGVYFEKNPLNLLELILFIFRPAYFRNWRLILSDPIHGIGMFFLKFMELSSGVAGYLFSKLPNPLRAFL